METRRVYIASGGHMYVDKFVDDWWNNHVDYADKVISALAAAGYKIVSREPTNTMRRAADERRGTGHPHDDIWIAMFDAAPPHPPQEKQT